MQENDIKITIKTLLNLGSIDALIALRNKLKIDYNLASEAVDSLKMSDINNTIESVQNISTYSDYNKDWSYPEKFNYILKKENRFLKFSAVAKAIVKIEGGGNEKYIAKRLTASTREYKLSGKIVKKSSDGTFRNTFWGSSKWLDEDGNIKKEHLYVIDPIKKEKIQRSTELFDDI